MLFMTSCSKDKGNYDYNDINELTISGIESSYNLLYKSDTLKINPTIIMTMDTNNPSRYEYEWKAIPSQNSTNSSVIIGNEQKLNYPVALSPGVYNLYFKVYDKQTDVRWAATYSTISVSTEIATGFLLIGDGEDENVEVEMISMLPNDTVIVKGLLKNNGLPPLKGAVGIMHTGSYFRTTNIKLWVMSASGSYFVDPGTFISSVANDFKSRVFTNFELPEKIHPVDIAPRVATAGGGTAGSGSRVVVCNDGSVFFANLSTGGDFYANPTNRSSKTPTVFFKAAPFLMYPPSSWLRYMIYDTDNNRFLNASPTAVSMTELADVDGAIFPWNQGTTGRRMVYAENTRNTGGGATNGSTFALMKDASGKHHIYHFYVATNPIKLGYYEIKSIAADFNQAKLFAFASKNPVLFYAVGSRLYGYDYNIGNEKNYLIKDFGEEITMLNCDIQTGLGTELYVATYSSAKKGTLQKFRIAADLNMLTLTPDENALWSGLTKIKQMDWRNAN